MRLARMPADVQVALPDDPRLLTPYVLTEQRDWFEDEIRFVRSMVTPGMSVIDVGASFGTYALTMARLVGPTGRVCAFEPTARTAEYLRTGVDANGLGSVVSVEDAALSDEEGLVPFHIHSNSELNGLGASAGAFGRAMVKTTSLDSLARKHDWTSASFVKIDAEGAERAILEGATRFLREAQPLVMFEVRHGAVLDLDILDTVGKLGLETYRLVPGINALVPFSRASTLDAFQLNIFACSSDRAEELRARGLLVKAGERVEEPGFDPGGRADKQLLAVEAYRCAVDPSCGVQRRSFAVTVALHAARQAALERPCLHRFMTLARIAREAGERAEACRAVVAAADRLDDAIPDGEPFLSPTPLFDGLVPRLAEPGGRLAALLEAHEKLSSYSSYFVGPSAIPRLERFAQLGLPEPEMARRLELLRGDRSREACFHRETTISP
jgi:FkbM family methyltransferase